MGNSSRCVCDHFLPVSSVNTTIFKTKNTYAYFFLHVILLNTDQHSLWNPDFAFFWAWTDPYGSPAVAAAAAALWYVLQGQIHAGSLRGSFCWDFTLTSQGKDVLSRVFSSGALKTSNDSDVLDVSMCEDVEHSQVLLHEAGQRQIWT